MFGIKKRVLAREEDGGRWAGQPPRWTRRWLQLGLLGIAVASGCQDTGRAPSLEPVEDHVVAVGEELVINLRATDPDGDDITYGFEVPSDELDLDAEITARPDGTGVFRWTPLAADVGSWAVDFTASDGEHTDRVTVMIDVRSAVAGSAPIFREPLGSGTTLDLERNACLQLDVVVEDQDDATVTLGQEAPIIEGAQLEQTAGLSGQWSWCPNKSQLDQDRYPLVLSADDGDNDKTLKNYLVVLRHPPRPDCPGDAPVIEHEPEDLQTVLDPEIVAEISDDKGLKNEPLLYYTFVEPEFPIDFSQLELVQMELRQGDLRQGTWSARIPNPIAGQDEGASAKIWYIISASDDDDEQGSCDHVTEAPLGGAFELTVTHPGEGGGAGVCEACSADIQCGGPEDLCVIVGNQGDSFCLASCDGDQDCGAGYSCTPVMSVDGQMASQCHPDNASCGGTSTCDDDAYEENDTRSQAENGPELEPGLHELVACQDDDDWYRVEVASSSTLGVLIEGEGNANLDLGLYDAQGTAIAVSAGPTSSEVVEECILAGTYYVRVSGTGPDDLYDLLLETTPGTCQTTCEDDSFEEDDTIAQANVADLDLGPYSATDRMLCSGDVDVYEVDMFAGETLVVDLTFTQTSPGEDLDIHLLDADGVDLTPCSVDEPGGCDVSNGQSGSSNEHFEWEVTSSATFYVAVMGYDGAENSYDIAIDYQ